ncbi:hypothetical protein KBG23_02725 [Candidatus Dojkabacteria bacterium]|jgi:hypothetical protein|nr:hypothetical protein [Candidatus Dojkabacteria bacterium]
MENDKIKEQIFLIQKYFKIMKESSLTNQWELYRVAHKAMLEESLKLQKLLSKNNL